ncbi:MAG: NAD-dependent epimerase/dehydratase family protein [Candidatus Peribacteraceae bacterium]|nr:NAD-dependent epimerase/dehydratase family protein [Candidatus Peribacteraceae bacterium]
MKRKRILIIGIDGYLGFPLALRCLHNTHVVHGIDNFSRRAAVEEQGSISATDILKPMDRISDMGMISNFTFHRKDIIKDRDFVSKLIQKHKFHTIVNLAHNPSAPYSMKDSDTSRRVLENNVIGTNNLLWDIKEYSPDSHYITIGSTGEYDHTIGVDIEEGYFQFEHKGMKSKECLFPRQGNSVYHCSKIASTYLIDYLTRLWNLKCTDVMQSIVYGLYTPEMVKYRQVNRCDTDDCFGTVINRFVVQAMLGEPLTVFGHGKHQRAFLSLSDSIQALEIAINNEPEPGVVQSWNQLSEWHSIERVADMVKDAIEGTTTTSIKSPRKEFTGGHHYNFETTKLKDLGYVPTRTIKEEIDYMIKAIRMTPIKREKLLSVIQPKVNF